MEEYEHIFKQNNPVSTVQAVTRLVKTIKEKKLSQLTEGAKNLTDSDIIELQFLKSKCGDGNPNLCLTASQGIVTLVEEGALTVGSTLSDLIVNLSNAKCCSGITMAIGSLLLIDMSRSFETKKKYNCPFGLQKNQHPFITVLSQNRDIWLDVYSQMLMFVQHFDNKISSNSIELLRPVFFFILCKPVNKLSDSARRNVWSLICSINRPDSQELAFEILSWIQMNSKQDYLDICGYLKESSHSAIQAKNSELCSVIILYLSSLLNQLVKEGGDPSSYVRTILELLKIQGTENTHSIVLMMLSDSISTCPSLYLKEILKLCNKIISKKCCNILSVKAIIASLLQWLIYPSNLLNEALKIAKDILNFTNNNDEYNSSTSTLFRNKYFKYVLMANPQISTATKLCLMAEKWENNKKYTIEWLNMLQNTSMNETKIFNFISAIFIHGFDDSKIKQKALEILLKIVKKSKEYATKVIVLIIFKLSNEREPETQVLLLKAIPKMAVLKENVPLVLTILNKTQKESGCLKNLCLTLFFELFLTEVRTFPYLQKMLLESTSNMEYSVIRAQTLKQICIERPDLHGKEMVGHLAQILNKHGDAKGSIASSLAIDGITALCEADIVDIVSTWSSIAPKFSKEKRTLVMNSLCNFFAGFGDLRVVSKDHEALVSEAITKLWYYVSYGTSAETVCLALKALSNFDVDQFTLKQLPSLFRQNLELPSAYAKTPDEAARKPEDVLPYIPGECWVQMLQNINHDAMEAAGDMLTAWIQAEISNYRSGIYIVPDGKTEPANYNYLQHISVIRGIGNAVRLTAMGDAKIPLSNRILVECLKILGQTYSKPLPPLNWCFLHDLFHKDDEIRRLCINVACKQILLSGSALRLIENYITSFEPSIEKIPEIIVLFSNLSFLCKGVQPNMLRPLITNSLQIAHELVLKESIDDSSLFYQLTDNIKSALLTEDIHEANRILIGQIIETFCEQMDGTSEIFDKFLDCIVEVPSKYMERISSPSLWWEVTQDKFERAVKVRCRVAKKSEKTPFVWLNECINTAATLKSVQIYLLRHIVSVFQTHCNRLDVGDWLLELLGQIQENLTKEKKEMDQVLYLCDVLLVAVIVLAGQDSFVSPAEQIVISKEARLSVFPNALLDLIRYTCANITVQVTEWLYHMISCTDVHLSYRSTFYQSLVLLRHEKAFIESARWMKYMSIKYPN